MKNFLENKQGMSLTTIIITIIVIIILATISYTALNSDNKATAAKYAQELEEVRKNVATQRMIDSEKTQKEADKSFSEVYLAGEIPTEFMYTSSGEEKVARLVNLETIQCKGLQMGQKYTDFEKEGNIIKTVTFGKDDVFVYDKNGKIFYVKGFTYDDKITYSTLDKAN